MIQWKKGRHPENQQRNKMQRRQYVDYINMCNVEKNKKKELRKGPTLKKNRCNVSEFEVSFACCFEGGKHVCY